MINRQVWPQLMKKLETGYERTTQISIVILAVNKCESPRKGLMQASEFWSLG